jgi:hypothetical protein
MVRLDVTHSALYQGVAITATLGVDRSLRPDAGNQSLSMDIILQVDGNTHMRQVLWHVSTVLYGPGTGRHVHI